MGDGPLSGRHALVTGGSRGIGRAIAATLARAGAAVTVMGQDVEALRAVVAAGEASGYLVADVAGEHVLRAEVATAEAARGPTDILVANAGQAVSARFDRADNESFRRMFEVNVLGTVNAVRAVAGGMADRGFGRIVAVASTAGLKGYPYVSAYCASKHAVVGLVRALALEYATRGVTVNAVCPGYTDTPMLGETVLNITRKTGLTPEDAVKTLVAQNPQKRLIDPAEVADAVLWLCGEAARSVTGQAIAVAGGEV